MNSVLKQRLYKVLNNNARDNETNTDENSENTEKQNIYGITDTQTYLDQLSKQIEDNADFSKLNNNIFGIPHQFLESTDMRIDDNNYFGYGYFDNIYREKPMVTLMPGKMLFLPDFNKDNKVLFSSLMGDLDNSNSKDALNDLIDEEAGSRYYDFTSDYTNYMTYVNLMCRVAACFLELDDKGYKAPDGGTYKLYDWKKYHCIEGYGKNGELNSVKDSSIFSRIGESAEQLVDDLTAGERCYVNFYIDPNSSANESITNTTQASQLEGAFESVEGIIKEADMLLQSVGGSFAQGIFDKAESMLTGLLNGMSFGFLKDLLGMGEKVLHGSNLIYPEIWSDSSYDKNFSIQINLSSPYGDTEAIYLNILVPIFHLLCLALPRQSSENSYNSPFLVRGYCQGWFAIDMGMVESISIDKGPEQSWNVQGLPTQAKVTLNIKELYGNLMMAPSNKPSYFFSNQGLLDYLGVTCGVDLTVPNIYFKWKVAYALLVGKITDIPNNTYYRLTESFRSYLGKFIN